MEFKVFQRSFVERISQNKSIDFSTVLIAGGDLTLEEALNVYSQDYSARMQEALGKNFESTWALLGDEEFFSLSKEYISQNPSQNENLTVYGNSFVEFLETKDLGNIVNQMAYFERIFWIYFHQQDRAKCELAQIHLTNGKFNLESYTFIQSSYDLKKIWHQRELGLGELALEDLEIDKNYILYRSQSNVEIQDLEVNIFNAISELKEKMHINKMSEQIVSRLTPQDWSIILDIIQYSDINVMEI